MTVASDRLDVMFERMSVQHCARNEQAYGTNQREFDHRYMDHPIRNVDSEIQGRSRNGRDSQRGAQGQEHSCRFRDDHLD